MPKKKAADEKIDVTSISEILEPTPNPDDPINNLNNLPDDLVKVRLVNDGPSQIHIENILSPATAEKCHAVIRAITIALPANSTANITQCLHNAVTAALEAYQSHTGVPFQI